MANFWELPQVRYIVRGLHADRPTRPDATHHAYYSLDTNTLAFSDIDRQWAEIGGSTGIPLSISETYTVSSGVQEVAIQTEITGVDGLLVIEQGSLVRFLV